jgi:demethylmenaquinone methyltransferase / 2-methoxy-6-polyprenyl-1,4-benzoquinol methylase
VSAPTPPPTPPHPVLKEYYSSAAERQGFVGELFDGCARYYNHIGRMLDLGSGPAYRKWAVRRAGLRPGMRLLDVATGTGLLARGAARVVGKSGRVIGVDPSRGMLQEAQKALPSSPLVQGRAEALPFRDASFDMLSMCFALRHVPDLDVAFGEYYRVLKPGGRLLLNEVSRPTSRILRAMFRIHFQHIMPWLARLTTRSQPAELLMKFYWDTIDQCVPPETIITALGRSGFVKVERILWWGFMSEYRAARPLP